MNHTIDDLWNIMKKQDNIIVRNMSDEIEEIRAINGKFFYVKCKAKDIKKTLEKEVEK